jgi:hypothetical protein
VSSALLMNERFVAVFPSLVRALDGDVAGAAVLQAIHYRLQAVKPEHGVQRVELLLADIADEVGLSYDQAKRVAAKLRERGLLLVDGSGNTARRWGVDYDALNALAGCGAVSPRSDTSGAVSPRVEAKSPRQRGEIAPHTSLLETKETKEPSTAVAVAGITAREVTAAYVDAFRERYGEEPPARNLGRVAREARQLLDEGKPGERVVQAAQHCAYEGHANIASGYTWVLAASQRGSTTTGHESGTSMYLRLAATQTVGS